MAALPRTEADHARRSSTKRSSGPGSTSGITKAGGRGTGASMMAPDYAHWHGMYEVAERFYQKLIPQAREIAPQRRRGRTQRRRRRRADKVIDEILARPEHQWFRRVPSSRPTPSTARCSVNPAGRGESPLTGKSRATHVPEDGRRRRRRPWRRISLRRPATRPRAWAARRPVDRADVAWDKAPCRFCGTGCGVKVGVEQRAGSWPCAATRLSPVNNGLLCVKGYHLPGLLYGARSPQAAAEAQRRRLRASRRISWDEALDLVASKFKDTLDAARPRRRRRCTARASGRCSTATPP